MRDRDGVITGKIEKTLSAAEHHDCRPIISPFQGAGKEGRRLAYGQILDFAAVSSANRRLVRGANNDYEMAENGV